ncbi:PE family protein [Mycobacterium asiaticum]|uniref:PE family protein n=1 Tax=Mycobacterium asiaticum TaxID=1790 RepID=UPI000ADADA68|nr:PE family protein [Mycobacterium asiaticum]
MQVATESLITAGRDLAAIGSDLNFAQLQAAAPTTNIASAGIDEVSTAVAGLFGSHAQEFQAVAGRAAAFHDQFIQKLTGGANAYATAEAENLAVLSAASAPAADDNPLLFLVQLGALVLTPGIFAGLLGLASTLLATYWAVQLFSAVFSG